MRIPVWRPVCLLALAAIFTSGARAQQDSETVKQFWPEVDLYVALNKKFRLFFLATTTKAEETRENIEGQVGAHIDYLIHRKARSQCGRTKAQSTTL
jgi:hypothetical protein